jgi:hypothetical protein
MTKDKLAALAEGVEAEFMYQYVSNTPSPAKASLGIETTRIGGGVVLGVRNDQTGYWSKALGFGFSEPVTAVLVDEVLDFYRDQGCRHAVIQIAPPVLPSDWNEICARSDLHLQSQWIKLACPIEDFGAGTKSGLRVGPIEKDSADTFASVMLTGFGMPLAGLSDMVAASVDNPDFRPFAAWDGDEIVAAANLFLRGEVGSLNSAATLPQHRNKGAQTALLVARAREAADAGCTYLVAEAAAPDGSTNSSLTNMLRLGFRPLYERQNWVWRPAS